MPTHHVLIIDDDDDLRTVLALLLGMRGIEVQTAADGAEGLKCIALQLPTVVLLDMRMPGMDGWTFAKELRARYAQKIPVVVMTAAADARQRAIEVEAEYFLPKPFEADELMRILDAVFEKSTTA